MLAGEPALVCCPPAHFIPYDSLFSVSDECAAQQRLSEITGINYLGENTEVTCNCKCARLYLEKK